MTHLDGCAKICKKREVIMFFMKFSELEKLTDQQLKEAYDSNIESHTTNPSFYLDELNRRTQETHTRIIKNLTVIITIMTGIMTAFTIANVILFCKLG